MIQCCALIGYRPKERIPLLGREQHSEGREAGVKGTGSGRAVYGRREVLTPLAPPTPTKVLTHLSKTNVFYRRPSVIGLITVFDAILTGRQSGQKLQCLYGNPIANNFFQN